MYVRKWIWGGKATAAAFKVVFKPLQPFKEHDFNSGWSSIFISFTLKCMGFDKDQAAGSFSLNRFDAIRRPATLASGMSSSTER
ncbi:hypothetical protein PAESOLCIP111_01738 [Paenibacillus solanacearum]|uniref:Uncharacterized protein n=1 Tax=Paenibacillus solanacearum TaxID=2048548 RepID=A0A916NHJ3_9BACL|nr:hypothetical protein PAESOLCIP111_01738 [Paenibacillus solanacearum]